MIADTMGVHKTTLIRALKPFLAIIKNPQAIQGYEDSRATLLNAAELSFLKDALHPSKMKRSSSRDSMVSFGIVSDKRRLEEGKSTANVSYLDLTRTVEQLEEDRDKLAKSIGLDPDEMEEMDAEYEEVEE